MHYQSTPKNTHAADSGVAALPRRRRRRVRHLFASLGAFAMAAMTWHAHAADITPYFQLDQGYAWANSDVRQLDDAYLVRRAELGVSGPFFDEDWSFKVGYDFAYDGELKDTYVRYHGFAFGDVTIGQFKVPFGLGELTSSKVYMLAENALVVEAFAPSRRTGVGFNRQGEHYTLAVMGFGPSIPGDEGSGVGARYTWAPIESPGHLLHLGVASVVSEPVDGMTAFGAGPESAPTGVTLVNTAPLRDVERLDRLGLELAWQSGPFAAQMEVMRARVDRRLHSGATVGGWYVMGSWMLGGGQRRYDAGHFVHPELGSSMGTFELTARYSHIGLDDGPILGGQESNISLGLNWYIGQHARIMFNYINVHSERRGISDDPDILLLHTQLFF